MGESSVSATGARSTSTPTARSATAALVPSSRARAELPVSPSVAADATGAAHGNRRTAPPS